MRTTHVRQYVADVRVITLAAGTAGSPAHGRFVVLAGLAEWGGDGRWAVGGMAAF